MRLKFSNYLILFLFTLSVKLWWLNFIQTNYGAYKVTGNYFAQEGVDTYTYLEPIDNYLSKGEYGMFWYKGFSNNCVRPAPATVNPTFERAIRTPYYGIIYGAFRLFFGTKTAYDFLALLQLLFEILSVILLAKIAFLLTRSKVVFLSVYFLFTVTSWTTFLHFS
jgi:hypothetical protein